MLAERQVSLRPRAVWAHDVALENTANSVIGTATAILDRFLHHADIIEITGRSYRLKAKPAGPEKTLARKARKLSNGPRPQQLGPACLDPTRPGRF